jgi:hypothetical protein
MPKTKAPWWMYVVACSYTAYVCAAVYLAFWGPEWVGINAIQDRSRVLIEAVLSDSPSAVIRSCVRPLLNLLPFSTTYQGCGLQV